jgi:hypothetical protein
MFRTLLPKGEAMRLKARRAGEDGEFAAGERSGVEGIPFRPKHIYDDHSRRPLGHAFSIGDDGVDM